MRGRCEIYRDSDEQLRQLRRKNEEAWNAYLGKRDLLLTHKIYGTDPSELAELEREVARRKQYLIHRGEILPSET